MGEKLVKIFDIVTNKAGYEGRIELAEKTGVSRKKAEELEDSPELIEKFKRIASQILGEEISID